LSSCMTEKSFRSCNGRPVIALRCMPLLILVSRDLRHFDCNRCYSDFRISSGIGLQMSGSLTFNSLGMVSMISRMPYNLFRLSCMFYVATVNSTSPMYANGGWLTVIEQLTGSKFFFFCSSVGIRQWTKETITERWFGSNIMR